MGDALGLFKPGITLLQGLVERPQLACSIVQVSSDALHEHRSLRIERLLFICQPEPQGAPIPRSCERVQGFELGRKCTFDDLYSWYKCGVESDLRRQVGDCVAGVLNTIQDHVPQRSRLLAQKDRILGLGYSVQPVVK